MSSSSAGPPAASTHEHVHQAHGVDRPDPYFWMRDKHAEAAVVNLRQERAYYDEQVEPLAELTRELLLEMTGRVAPVAESARWQQGKYEYFTRTRAGGEYDQFCRVDAQGTESLLLDENELLGDSTYVELGLRLVSPDGRWLAYSVDTAGDEVFRLHFRDLTTGEDLVDEIARSYYEGAWSADSGSFFYVVHNDLYRPFQVWRHVLGTPPDSDALVFDEPDPQFDVFVWADRAGELIVIRTTSRITSEVWLVSAHEPQKPARLVAERRRGIEYSVAHLPGAGGGSLLIVTNDGAEEFRLVRSPITNHQPEKWVEVIGELPAERIHDIDVFAGYVVMTSAREGQQLLRILPWSAFSDAEPLSHSLVVDAGVPGGLLSLSHNEEFDATHIQIEVESYVEPLRWLAVSLATGEREQVAQHPVPEYDPTNYVLEERWIKARDGQRLPIRLVRNRQTPLDGSSPLLLYGYGAYESSFWPGFESWLPSLLDRGVVFVHAGIRGGGEMGHRWWRDGSMLRKLNTFTDFIDTADELVAESVIDGSRIVSRGLSAGGLLQGAVYSMRPDRWRAVVAEVPFVDVVTTMFDLNIPLSAGELDEWGDPRLREQFAYILSYSPYDNVPVGHRPDLLVTGALHDPRVMVHEPAKWVARLRATDDGHGGQTLFRVEVGEGGHTGPTGRYEHLAYEAEVAAYILDKMGARERMGAAD